MECPYCGKELTEGHIRTAGEVIKWLPAGKIGMTTTLRWQVGKNELKLGKYNFATGGDVAAYRCEDCKKIIIEY